MFRKRTSSVTDPKKHLRELLDESVFPEIHVVENPEQVVSRLDNAVYADCDLSKPVYRVLVNIENQDVTSFWNRGSDIDHQSYDDLNIDHQHIFCELGNYDLAVIGTDPQSGSVIIGQKEDGGFGPFTVDEGLINGYTENGESVSPFEDELQMMGGSCPIATLCGRFYLYKPGVNSLNGVQITTMESVCSTENLDGLVKVTDPISSDDSDAVDEKSRAFWTLAQHAPRVIEYMEDCAYSDDSAYLWVHDGMYIGLLYARRNHIVGVIISFGYRGQGHGKEFVETWADHTDYDEFYISTFSETDEFAQKLDIERNTGTPRY